MSSNCNPLHGLCVLLNILETHLMRRDFMNPELAPPLLPEDTPIQLVDATDLRKTAYAHPIVAYKRGDIVIQRSNQGQLSNSGINDMYTSVSLVVSTAVKSLTEALSFELGSILWALDVPLKGNNLYMQRVVVGEVKHDPENHCYESIVNIEVSLGKPVWKSSTVEGIVREVRLQLSASNSTL